ncbi:MAG: hypothetical protein A4S09_09305 [Proteobacteria bacterium SG_bin7]|nr:MAG: hypothetical protein A4S09_09305 [Proteobacteria bacterium SG_bin7]
MILRIPFYFVLASLLVLSFANAIEPANETGKLEQFLFTLQKIDPQKTDDPTKFKKIKTIASNYIDCLRSSKAKTEDIKVLVCQSLLEAQFNKLGLELDEIAEADFVKNVRRRALHNLSTTYAYLQYQFRERDQKEFNSLCDDVDHALDLEGENEGVCDGKEGKIAVKVFNDEIERLKRENLPDLKTMQDDYNKLLNQHINGKTYIARCEETKKELLKTSGSNKDVDKKLKDLNIQLAQYIRSSALTKMKLDSQPIALLFENDEFVENETIKDDPLVTKFDKPFDQATKQAKNSIRQRTAELLGHGELANRKMDGVGLLDNNQVNKLQFFAHNYPVALGQTLAQFPSMIKKVCENLSDIKSKHLGGYDWGDRILGSKVMVNPVYDGLFTSVTIKKEDDARLSDFLNESKVSCEAIDNEYRKLKIKASDRDAMLKENEYLTNFKIVGRKIPRAGLNGLEAEIALKVSMPCTSEYYNAFKIDMMNRAISTLEKIASDKDLANLLNEYALKYGKDDKITTEFPMMKKMNALIAVLSRFPENKFTKDTVTQDELIGGIKAQLTSSGNFNIEALVKRNDTECAVY